MPNRLVIVAEEVLARDGHVAAPVFEALGRLAHAGHPVAVILAGDAPLHEAAIRLQQLANDAGGPAIAFFQRPRDGLDIGPVLDEATARWRIDRAQVHGVFNALGDLGTVARFGGQPIALDADASTGLPDGCLRYADLDAFVIALLTDPEPAP